MIRTAQAPLNHFFPLQAVEIAAIPVIRFFHAVWPESEVLIPLPVEMVLHIAQFLSFYRLSLGGLELVQQACAALDKKDMEEYHINRLWNLMAGKMSEEDTLLAEKYANSNFDPYGVSVFKRKREDDNPESMEV